MKTSTQDSEIEKTLKLIGFKVTDERVEAWNISLNGIPNSLIIKAREEFLKNGVKSGERFPQPYEFRDLCREVKKQLKKETEPEPEQRPNYNNIPAFSEKAKQISKSTDAVKRKTIKKSNGIILYLCPDNIRCHGHVTFKEFSAAFEFDKSKSCDLSKKGLSKIRHGYRLWKRIATKDNSGKIVSYFNTYVDCDEKTYGAEPITIGYF